MWNIFNSNKINSGLNEEDVIKNRKKYGTNKINPQKKEGFFKLFIETLGDPIIKILLIALAVKTIFLIKDFDWFETLGIVIAIFLASFISSISEYGSNKAFERLQEESLKIKCRVKRNNKIVEIGIDDVVYNDIVLLSSGDKIPADGIIVSGSISVDESSINGEARDIHKVPINRFKKEIEKRNEVYRGTVVYSGIATMLVTSVGDNTLYGKLSKEIQEKQPPSPLNLKLKHLATIISKIGYVGAILVSLSYLFSVIVIDNNFNMSLIISSITNYGELFGHILYALTLSVTIIVVAVPEGLPMMITLVLSSNMKRMLKNNVLVRKLVGIETSGSINILFTDKTGTLTKGTLEVIGFMTGNLKEFNNEVELLKYRKLHNLVKLSFIYNNESTYSSDKSKVIGGNITDRAILSFIKTDTNMEYNIIDKIPFNSSSKYSASIINYRGETKLIKGATERILPYCTSYINEDGIKCRLNDKRKINNQINIMMRSGIRVLTIAYSDSIKNEFSDLTLIGFVFIKDEVREDAITGIKTVNDAHIQTVMITGDNKDTALNIGREVGLIKSNNDIVLTSDEMNKMSDDEIKKILPKLKIVARSLPQDKSRLVKISQEMNLVVGMTGDGVNDAPALKRADVGFAMGSGTEVAKEASDIIILDDNFNSIAKAILFGRTIFKSIRKFIIFQLTVNFCAISLSIIGPFIGVDTPVTVIQMLWINMVMDTLAGLAFAFEPPLKEYMEEYPKKRDEAIINRYMFDEIIFTGIYSSLLCILFLKLPFITNLFRGSNDNIYLMTAFFGLFIFMGIFNCFNARTCRLNLLSNLHKNRIFILIIIFVLIVQMYLIYFGGSLFRSAGLTIKEFIITIILSATVIPVDWIRKIYLRLKGNIGGV